MSRNAARGALTTSSDPSAAGNTAAMSHVPSLSLPAAAAIAAEHFGIVGSATPLPSERDQNVRLTTSTGAGFILKIANAAESGSILDAECRVMQHLAGTGVCPTVVPTTDGAQMVAVHGHTIRLITALAGRALGSTALHTDHLRSDIGRALGRIDAALATFDHSAFHRDFHWDLANADRVVHELLPLIADRAMQEMIASFAAYHQTSVIPLLPSLRRSIIHSDANDYNILVNQKSQTVTGIVDFGDMVYSHTINDLAIAMAYVALGADDPLAAATAVVSGYHETHPVTDTELASLFSLMCMRLCMSACMAAKQQAERPEDAYLGISQAPIRRILPILAAIHPRFALYSFRAACALPPVPHAPQIVAWLAEQAPGFAPLLGADRMRAPLAALDFSAGSALIASDPIDNVPAELDRRVHRVLAEQGATVGVGGYGEARLIYHWPHEPERVEPRTIHMGVDLSTAAGTPLHAPIDGVVHGFENADRHHDYGPLIVLRHQTTGHDPQTFYTLYGHLSPDSLDGLEIGQFVARGSIFARIGSAPTNGNWWAHVHVQLITDMLDVPCNVDGAVRASQRHVWESIFPDPNTMLGIPVAARGHTRTAAEIAIARKERIGSNLSVSYGAHPLNIVRGRGQYLYNEQGHRFTDVYNNVAHVGHCHPRVVRAVSEQLATLNTNTRYLQDQLTEYADSLTALLPGSLSVCYFTASGSEANELALRLARAHTGERDLIVMDSAYHGHTTTLIDISPYKHAGPGGTGAPDWVHTSPIPDVYRTRGIVGDPGEFFAAAVAGVIDKLTANGRGLSAYIAETCPSVAGQIMLPAGFLANVYRRVRAAGGVCIADEVQTGFGRMGTHFWAFEAHEVIPDIVVLGKPIANGYPMGAVITTREIARSFDNGMEYFSTFGGSTAACVAGLTTLRVTVEEELQRNALVVGQRLLDGLRPLVNQYAVVGDVRGSGLFLGVELVRDRDTLAPAAEEATMVVNRMRERGVLAGTDGPYHNVIKLRGPMPLSLDDADQVVDVMTQSLRELPEMD